MATDSNSRLRELVQRHQVCFESYPIWHIKGNGARVAIGYELDLAGIEDFSGRARNNGHDDWTTVYGALLTIANEILSLADPESRCVIEPLEAAIHFSPRRKMRRDIVLAIDITHRDPFDAPASECEMRCLREFTGRLKSLGARPDRW